MKQKRVKTGWLQLTILSCLVSLTSSTLHAATITGRITNNSGNGIENVCVNADDMQCMTYSSSIYTVQTDANGNYSINLEDGDYYINTDVTCGGSTVSTYIDKQYTANGGSTDCNDAETVASGASSIDLTLNNGGSISGTVLDSHGNVLSGDGWKSVSVFQGSCDNLQQVTYIQIDGTTGEYTVTGLVPGEYYVQTYVPGTSNIDEFWAEGASVSDCPDADTITVTAGQTSTEKNFQLDEGGKISGTVYQADGIIPITGDSICVDVYSNTPCDGSPWQRVGGGCTNPTDGTYMTGGLAPGTYYLYTNTSDTNYIEEYWAAPHSTQECTELEKVTVTTGQTNSGKDFQLNMGGIISGTVYDESIGTPITGQTDIEIQFYTGDPCGDSEEKGGVYIKDDGTFSVSGVGNGAWYVRTWTGRTAYVPEWRTDTSSDVQCTGASLVTMENGTDITNLDFHLEKGARISGHVYERDGKTPINSTRSLRVQVLQGKPCEDFTWFTSAVEFAQDGSYLTGGLPEGTFYLRFKESGSDTSDDIHQREWWAAPLSTPQCSDSQPVVISGITEITNKDFQIDTTKKFPWSTFLPAILIQHGQ